MIVTVFVNHLASPQPGKSAMGISFSILKYSKNNTVCGKYIKHSIFRVATYDPPGIMIDRWVGLKIHHGAHTAGCFTVLFFHYTSHTESASQEMETMEAFSCWSKPLSSTLCVFLLHFQNWNIVDR